MAAASDSPPFTFAPSLDDLERIARAAFAALPGEFRDLVGDVVFRIDDFPDAATEEQMGLRSPFDLLGLYRGIPIGDKQFALQSAPDMIFLYRRPLLEYWCETGEDLTDLVRHVLVHEIGHHFGLSDADMARIDSGAGD